MFKGLFTRKQQAPANVGTGDINVAICRIARGKWERTEVGTFLAQALRYQHPRLAHVWDITEDVFGAHVARNHAVAEARRRECGLLFMIDADMVPSLNFYPRALEFLLHNPGAVIASPYLQAVGDAAGVQAFRATEQKTVERYPQEQAFAAKGIEQVFSVGCGLIAFDLKAFDKIEPPYFDFTYADPKWESMAGTEDIYCTGRMSLKGGLVCVDWESWSGHAKEIVLGKPNETMR